MSVTRDRSQKRQEVPGGAWEAEGPHGFRLSPPLRSERPGSGVTAPGRRVCYLPKLSNSPFRTPPRNACHSSGVNWRTAPAASLLLRTPTPPSARLATSTQLPLEKLSELLIQVSPESGLTEGSPCIGIPMSFTSLIVVNNPGARLRNVALSSLIAIVNSKVNRQHRHLGSRLPQINTKVRRMSLVPLLSTLRRPGNIRQAVGLRPVRPRGSADVPACPGRPEGALRQKVVTAARGNKRPASFTRGRAAGPLTNATPPSGQ